MENHDVVLKVMEQIYCWPKSASAGYSVTGTTIGRLVLTRDRLIFLSTGTSGLAKQLAAGLLLGGVGAVVFGKTRTDELDLSALEHKDSWEIPLSSLRSCEAKRRLDFAMYLSLHFTDESGVSRARSVMTKTGFQWAIFKEWAAEIEGLRHG